MRDAFHGDLARLGTQLAGMCERAGAALTGATAALLEADLAVAEQVLAGDAGLDEQRALCQELAYELLALQAPVARDLRVVLAAVYCSEKVERMGDLAAHIADTARFAHPDHAVPAELADMFAALGRITAGMAGRIGALITGPAEGGFAELDQADHEVDALHARLLAVITTPDWAYGPTAASRLALVGRFYERFGDQAVSVAKRLEFAQTGALPASPPNR